MAKKYNHDDLPPKKKKRDPAEYAKFLFDATVRRQIYLEGVKLHYAKQFSSVASALEAAIAVELNKLKRNQLLGDLTRVEYLMLVSRIRKRMDPILIKWSSTFTLDAREFLAIDVDLAHAIYGDDSGKDVNKSAQNNQAGYTLLWASVTKSLIPAAGGSLVDMIAAFIGATTGKVVSAIGRARADMASTQDALTGLANALVQATNGVRGTVGTILQHVGTAAQEAVASEFFGKYVWTSIIDNVTTDICRHRNMMIFEYGRGPLPPAHYGCRSVAVPVVDGVAHDKQTYYTWLRSQPEDVQDDILSPKRGRDLRSGELKASDLDRFDGASELALEQYSGKAGFILRNRIIDNGTEA